MKININKAQIFKSSVSLLGLLIDESSKDVENLKKGCTRIPVTVKQK